MLNFMESHSQSMTSLGHHPVLLSCQEFIHIQRTETPIGHEALKNNLKDATHLICELQKLATLFEFVSGMEMADVDGDEDPFDFGGKVSQFERTNAKYGLVLTELRTIRTRTLQQLAQIKKLGEHDRPSLQVVE